MTKQELAHIARLMYDLQEHCAFNFWEIEKPCKECAANKKGVCDLFVPCHGVPKMWGITKADIERWSVKAMAIDEALQIDDMHANEFLRQAYREAAMYELKQYAKEVEKEKREREE